MKTVAFLSVAILETAGALFIAVLAGMAIAGAVSQLDTLAQAVEPLRY